MKVYLCGPIAGCTDEECKGWRERAKAVLHNTLDPMDRDYRGREAECYREVVELDKLDINQSEALLVNFPRPSVGTCMEILYAWEHQKIIILVVPKDIKLSPWLLYHATKIFNSFADAIEYLKQYERTH